MKKRNQITYFLKEIIIVVVGVLIAISLNNLKEKMDNTRYIEKTLLAIESEIELSKNDVQMVLNKHLNLIDSLESEINNNEDSLGEMLTNLGGVQMASIKNISLRFFISNKAELLDFNLLLQLLEIENQTDILSAKIERLANYSTEHINEQEAKTKLAFAYLLSDVIDSEQGRLESYSTFLNKNKRFLEQD